MQDKPSTKTKKSIPTPIITPPLKKNGITIYINKIPLDVLQIDYKETVKLLGVRVCFGNLVLPKDQAIAFRSTLLNTFESKIDIEVIYYKDDKIKTIDLLKECRIIDIENIQVFNENWKEKIQLEISRIEYGIMLE